VQGPHERRSNGLCGPVHRHRRGAILAVQFRGADRRVPFSMLSGEQPRSRPRRFESHSGPDPYRFANVEFRLPDPARPDSAPRERVCKAVRIGAPLPSGGGSFDRRVVDGRIRRWICASRALYPTCGRAISADILGYRRRVPVRAVARLSEDRGARVIFSSAADDRSAHRIRRELERPKAECRRW